MSSILGAKVGHGSLGRYTRDDARVITEKDIREALLQYAESNLCYGRNPARKMNILRISTFQAYRYHSDVFVESRELKWQSVPYHKPSFIDGPENGQKPLLWQSVVDPPNGPFRNAQLAFEIPHSATVSNCTECQGSGFIPCEFCCGDNNDNLRNDTEPGTSRRNRCVRCDGKGFITEHLGEGKSTQHKCHNCGGSCVPCLGKGKISCKRCHGSGLLKSFQQLEIKWNNISEWNVVLPPGNNCEGLRPKHLATATGEELIYESDGFNEHLNKMDSFPDPGVRESSSRTFTKLTSMTANNSSLKILKTKQTVVTIIVAEVDAVWDNSLETFYVFGNDRRVFFPNSYPENCCRMFKFQCYVT